MRKTKKTNLEIEDETKQKNIKNNNNLNNNYEVF